MLYILSPLSLAHDSLKVMKLSVPTGFVVFPGSIVIIFVGVYIESDAFKVVGEEVAVVIGSIFKEQFSFAFKEVNLSCLDDFSLVIGYLSIFSFLICDQYFFELLLIDATLLSPFLFKEGLGQLELSGNLLILWN